MKKIVVKIQFIVFGLICAMVVLLISFAIASRPMLEIGPPSNTNAIERTARLRVVQHPDADLCIMHYPKTGNLRRKFAGAVDCGLVRDRLASENNPSAVADLARMTFVRDVIAPALCYGVIKYSYPIPVDCGRVEHLIEGERYCRGASEDR